MVPFFIDTRFPQILWDYYWLFFVTEDQFTSLWIKFSLQSLPGDHEEREHLPPVRWVGCISLRVGFLGGPTLPLRPEAQGCDVKRCFQLVSISNCAPHTGPRGASLVGPQVSPGPFTCWSWNCSHFFHRPRIVGDMFSSDLVPLSILISSIEKFLSIPRSLTALFHFFFPS